MRTLSCSVMCAALTAIVGVSWPGSPSAAAPLPSAAMPSEAKQIRLEVGRRWYRDDVYIDAYDDDIVVYEDMPDDYPPPVRSYRYAPPPPPVVIYEPPVYGWIAPPRPASCGKYRYWNGYRCADARKEPPYIGPRW